MSSRRLILVLDDDMSVLRALERLLKAREFDVESFHTIDGFMQRANLREAACLVLGCAAYLFKPFSSRDLVAAIEAVQDAR